MNLEGTRVIWGAPLAVCAFLIGQFDGMFLTLVTLVIIDFITGILKALHNKNLDSQVMFQGGIKKAGIFLIVMVANIIDNSLELGFALRTVTIAYFITNESVSTLENWAGMGLPIPQKLRAVLKQLQVTQDIQGDDKK